MYGLRDNQIKTLMPMSTEDLKARNYRNSRHGELLQLWFVDGWGNGHCFINSEIIKLALDLRWPWYMKHNRGIHAINSGRQNSHDHTTPYPGDGGIQFEPEEQP